MLDSARWQDTSVYLAQDLRGLLVDIEREVNVVRQALVTARLQYSAQADEVRLMHWQDSVAAQERAIDLECRLAHNVIEQAEADLQQLLDERSLVRLLVETNGSR